MKKMIIIGGIAVVLIAVILVVVLVVLPNRPEKPVEELLFPLEEMYTNIPVGDDAGSYKILKMQVTIVYTDPDFLDTLTKNTDVIRDFLNGYFRDVTLETVNRKNGKERVKEEITEQLIELLGTDAENLRGVLMPEFIIQ